MPKFCENCGGVVRDNQLRCPHCGFTEITDDIARVDPDVPLTNQPDPESLLEWMKEEEPITPEDQVRQEINLYEDRNRGSLEDLRRRYEQKNTEADEILPEEEELEDNLDKNKKKNGFMSMLKGSFGKNGVYHEPDTEEEMYEDDGEDDLRPYDQTYSMDEELAEEPVARWQDEEEEEGEYEEAFYMDDERIYEDESSFLKKIIIICGVVILSVGLIFVGVQYFDGKDDTEIDQVLAEQEKEVIKAAEAFFTDIFNVDPDDLDNYAGIYFGNYQKDEEALQLDLSYLSALLAQDVSFDGVDQVAVTGNSAAVRMKMEGSKEAIDLLEESKFYLDGEEWKFDFAFFADQLTPSLIEDEEEPQDAFEDEAITDTIQAFNAAWVEYVNTGRQDVFNYLNPGSAAYRRIANADVNDLTESLLEHRLKDVTSDGKKAQVSSYEKYKKTRNGTVTIAEYDWRYELVYKDGRWLIDDYKSIKPPVKPDEEVDKEKEPVKPELEKEPEPEAEKPQVPEGFTQDKTFKGGSVDGGDRLASLRFAPSTNRFVLDFFKGPEAADQVAVYSVSEKDQVVRILIEGLKESSATAPLAGGLIKSVDVGPLKEGMVGINIKLADGVYYKAFTLGADNDASARLVLDFVKP